MKTTYVIEQPGKYGPDVVEYFKLLGDAQRFCVKYYDSTYTILCLKGVQFGEGYHAYRMVLDRDTLKFKYIRKE